MLKVKSGPSSGRTEGRAPVSNAEAIIGFARAADWHAWLKANHARSRGGRLRIAKGPVTERGGNAGAATDVSYAEGLDAALVWGWIDSRNEALDPAPSLQRVTP